MAVALVACFALLAVVQPYTGDAVDLSIGTT
jgi:hypothetical protein